MTGPRLTAEQRRALELLASNLLLITRHYR
jgi:hypothetical protein